MFLKENDTHRRHTKIADIFNEEPCTLGAMEMSAANNNNTLYTLPSNHKNIYCIYIYIYYFCVIVCGVIRAMADDGSVPFRCGLNTKPTSLPADSFDIFTMFTAPHPAQALSRFTRGNRLTK